MEENAPEEAASKIKAHKPSVADDPFADEDLFKVEENDLDSAN